MQNTVKDSAGDFLKARNNYGSNSFIGNFSEFDMTAGLSNLNKFRFQQFSLNFTIKTKASRGDLKFNFLDVR